MKIFKNILVLLAVFFLSYFSSPYFGQIYLRVFPSQSAGSYIDGTALIGMPLGYIIFSILLFIIFGDKNKYSWISVALIPPVLIEVALDIRHIYFPVALALVAWGVGLGIIWLIKTVKSKKF